jgi:hypothetical protein
MGDALAPRRAITPARAVLDARATSPVRARLGRETRLVDIMAD